MNSTLLLGDCLEVLKTLPDNSIDSVVTDPPYGLSFMNKKWDHDVPSVDVWVEVLRVLKPGGHLLSFGGTRTYHRLVVAIEDAGFEIRDQVQWIYGQGFPKSLDISKGIDKAEGITEWKETIPNPALQAGNGPDATTSTGWAKPQRPPKPVVESKAAKQWSGWGTALKPANEPICLARKPISEKTVAANVLKWGTGGLNIDAARIEGGLLPSDTRQTKGATPKGTVNYGGGMPVGGHPDSVRHNPQGRFPANVLLDETAAEMLDAQTQNLHGAGAKRDRGLANQTNDGAMFGVGNHEGNGMRFGDSGGASRFFYCAKASTSERNAGCEGLEEKTWQEQGFRDNDSTHLSPRAGAGRTRANSNNHPTVKPIRLMEYLIKLITPPGGVVLDPFMGSGTTGVAAKKLGYEFKGIELDSQYYEIASARIANG